MAAYRVVDVDELRMKYCNTEISMCQNCDNDTMDCQRNKVFTMMDVCEMLDNIDESDEGISLDKVARFLGRNFEPPCWYRNTGDMLDVKKRLERERERMEHPEEVWKDVLRAAAMEAEE